MAKKKSTELITGQLVPQKHGGALRHGGTSKGGTGRPPDAFKAMCAALASSKEVEKAVKRVLKDENHPAFVGALKWATEHGYKQEVLTLVHPEVILRIQKLQQVIASRPTWDSGELLDLLGSEVFK